MPKSFEPVLFACVLAAGLGLALGSGPAFAQQQRPAAPARPAAPPPPPQQQAQDEDPLEKCGALQGIDKVGACMKKVLTDSEAELAKILKTAEGKIAQSKLPPADRDAWKNAFNEAQATWKRFVDLDCDGAAVREAQGQPGAAIVAVACRASHVRSRVGDLEGRYSD